MEISKMNYVIEGTISELSLDEKFFRIKGCEDFSIIQDKKKYNLLCPEKLTEKEDVKLAFLLTQDFMFPFNENNKDLLIHTFSNDKRIRISIRHEVVVSTPTIDLNMLKSIVEKQKNEDIKKFVISVIEE